MSLPSISGDYAAVDRPQALTATGPRAQAPADVANSTPEAALDSASISPAGRLLSHLPPLFSPEIAADGVITGEEMGQFWREKSADLQEEVRQRLAAQGLDSGRPLDLTTDARGQVRVANDHPDREAIEALFADDPDLANRFRQVAATGSLLRAMEAHTAFARDYARDPQAAVARHAHLFSALQPEYLVRLDQDGVSMVEAG